MLVKNRMATDVITLSPDQSLLKAMNILHKKRIRHLPVVQGGKVVGIVTLGDIREASPSNATALSIYELNYLLARLTVGEIMTRDPFTVSPDTSIEAAARIMLEHKIGSLPVVAEMKLVGIITESDIFRLLVTESEPRPTFA